MNKMKILRFYPLFILFAFFLSCGLPVTEDDGNLIFPDFVNYRSIYGGVRGAVDFSQVLVGEGQIEPLRVANGGASDLTIDSITMTGVGFDFANRRSPEFPVTIPPNGETTFFLAFYPGTNGIQTEKAAVIAGGITRFIELSGTGMWEVIFSINANDGEILSPVPVTDSGVSQTITTADGILSLSAQAGFLRKLSTWSVIGTPLVSPEFEDIQAADTKVIIKDHTHIQAVFLNPWIFYPSGVADLQTAVTNAAADPAREGVIIENGVHSVTGSVNIPAGVSLYGGYNGSQVTVTARLYQTPADRENAAYRGFLNFTAGNGITISDGTGVTIEGLTLNQAAGGTVPLLRVLSPTTPLIQYNTLTAGGSGAALETQGSSPQIKYNKITGGNNGGESTAVKLIQGAPYLQENDIRGGNTTGNFSESYTIWGLDNTQAVLFKNTITGGSAGGVQSESFGIYLDWECRPLIIGNTITGGSAPGSGGETNGIYFINNGKSTVRYNSIDGGTGAGMARALYSAYGTNFYLRHNNLFNSSGGSRYGIYLGANGRIRRLAGNGFLGVTSAYQYTLISGETVSSIPDLNSLYNADNVDGTVSFTIPDEPGVQEWNE